LFLLFGKLFYHLVIAFIVLLTNSSPGGPLPIACGELEFEEEEAPRLIEAKPMISVMLRRGLALGAPEELLSEAPGACAAEPWAEPHVSCVPTELSTELQPSDLAEVCVPTDAASELPMSTFWRRPPRSATATSKSQHSSSALSLVGEPTGPCAETHEALLLEHPDRWDPTEAPDEAPREGGNDETQSTDNAETFP